MNAHRPLGINFPVKWFFGIVNLFLGAEKEKRVFVN